MTLVGIWLRFVSKNPGHILLYFKQKADNRDVPGRLFVIWMDNVQHFISLKIINTHWDYTHENYINYKCRQLFHIWS